MLLFILISYLFFQASTFNIPDFKFKSTIFVPPTDNGFDQCKFFKIKNNNMYRMGQSNIIGKWGIYNNSDYIEQNKYYSVNWSPSITNLGLSWNTDEMTAVYYNSSKFDIINSIDLTIIKSPLQLNTSQLLKGIATTANYFYMLVNHRNTVENTLLIYYKNNISFYYGFSGLVQNQGNITVSKEDKNVFLWTNTSDMNGFSVNLTSTNFIYGNTDSTYSRNHTLNDIQFSLDGKLAVFQYDDKYPLTIFDLTTNTVLKTKNFTAVINQVLFLDSGTLLGVCLNYSRMEIYDIATLTLQKTVLFSTFSNYSAIHYESQTFYQCLKGNISSTQMICPALSFYNLTTFSCVDCDLSKNCTQCDASTGECTACQEKLTLINGTCIPVQNNPLIMLSNQISKIYQFGFLQSIAYQISNNLGIISVVMLSIQMSPFSMIFIQFIAFWNICCLYSMINLQNSVSITFLLKQIYKIVQNPLFKFLGINFNDNVLSNKSVDSQYPSFYNVQYDVINSNLQNVVIMGSLIILIIITKILKRSAFNNVKFIKYILSFSRTQAILGQFISFIPMSILPFKNFIQSSGSLNLDQKSNNFLLIILVLFFIISPFYILIHYYNKILKLFGKLNKFLNKKKNSQIITKKPIFEQDKRYKSIFNTNNWLIPPQAQYRFLNAFVNLCVPILIILPYNQPFFVISLFIYGYQVHVATKLSHYKIINIILSTIFLNFHLFYMICYLSNDYFTIFQYASLICFSILVIGGFIELLIVFLICLYQILAYLNKLCKPVKIQYTPNNSNKQQNIFSIKDTIGQSQKKHVKIIDIQIQNNNKILQKKNNFLKQLKRHQEIKKERLRKKFQIQQFKNQLNQTYESFKFQDKHLVKNNGQSVAIAQKQKVIRKKIIVQPIRFNPTQTIQRKRYKLEIKSRPKSKVPLKIYQDIYNQLESENCDQISENKIQKGTKNDHKLKMKVQTKLQKQKQ